MPDYVVVWNGTREHPAGRQLFTPEERTAAPALRTLRDLSLTDRFGLAQAVRQFDVETAARWYGVAEATARAALHYGAGA